MKINSFSQFQNKFNSVFEKSNKQKFVIDNEISAVINYVNTIPNYGSFRKPVESTFKNKTTQIFELEIPVLLRSLFSESFNQFILGGNYKNKRLHSDTDEIFMIKEETTIQSYEFSEYYKWLNELLLVPQKAQKKSVLSHKQKLLALHYLGLDTSKYDNTKIAKILSEILDLSEDNTRQYLSYVTAGKNDVRTKNNLEKVNQLFENQGITDVSNAIKKDLEKL
ncbi:hypothetical protein [Flavobacterium sp.]|uniref:hypothetical protein n=1 Tax=Flavobacterium sp. TaxID=239 RepID=UPI0025C2F8E1|nr:hypothetical protein [Flavobacterium sp.]MBA4275307.1 hypothetical protein [Flavobacterium sp.]